MDFAIDFLNTLSFSSLFVGGFWGLMFLWFISALIGSVQIVSSKTARVVERFGDYNKTLNNGFHVLVPFVDRVAYKHDLKLKTLSVPSQECFTADEVNVTVDGVIYLTIVDPVKASYGTTDYYASAISLAQTTVRSVLGEMSLDKTFESRESISVRVTEVLNNAGAPWGIKVDRYEVKAISPPRSVTDAMEMKMEAERERKKLLAESLARKTELVEESEAARDEMINISEGDKEGMINRAKGRAEEITNVAKATAEAIRRMGTALQAKGGRQAFDMQLQKQYLDNIALFKKGNPELIVPANILNYNEFISQVQLGQKAD